MLTDQAFIRFQGGGNQNFRTNKLNIDEIKNDECDQIQIVKCSSYFDCDIFESLILSNRKTYMFQYYKFKYATIRCKI